MRDLQLGTQPGLCGSVAEVEFGPGLSRPLHYITQSLHAPVTSEWKRATSAQRSEGLGQSCRAAEQQPLNGMPDILSTNEWCPQVTTQRQADGR